MEEKSELLELPLKNGYQKEKDNRSDSQSESSINQNEKSPKSVFIGVLLLFLIIIIALIFLILFLYGIVGPIKDKDSKENDYIETSLLMYGSKISNISYAKNNTIVNSFKEGGYNYNEEIGNVNNGSDYEKTDRNVYTLFMPYSATKNMDNYNGIFLFINGKLWTEGNKEYLEPLAQIYAQSGYITAVMDYTLLNDNYSGHNIFRILDEVTACIESIKEELNNMGFNKTKLELAIGGYSSGAYIGMLYSYLLRETPLPIKFIINIAGPVTLYPQIWKKLKDENDTLENIEPNDIEKALNESKIIDAIDDEYDILNYMNNFIGKKYNDSELKEMIENKKIKVDNEKYQELLKIVKFTFPSYYAISNIIPTLCVYGGNDSIIGVSQYAFLKSNSKSIRDKIKIIYSRYADHSVINYSTENGINAMREMHYQILNFAKLYFSS